MGTVLSVRVQGVGRNAVSLPTVEFSTADGVVERTEPREGSRFQGYTVGEQVPIRYDPDDPTSVEVDTFGALWGTALLRAGFGALFLIMGVVGLVIGR